MKTTQTERVGVVACEKIIVCTDIGWRGPGFCMDPCTFFLRRNGANDHDQPRSVPLVPMLFGEGSGTLLIAPSRNRRHVNKRVGNICIRLGLRVGDLQTRPVFRGCRMA